MLGKAGIIPWCQMSRDRIVYGASAHTQMADERPINPKDSYWLFDDYDEESDDEDTSEPIWISKELVCLSRSF